MKGQAEKQWANVESAYQRRSDLIGNLVKTVQGAADFERGTLTDVIEARSKATSVQIDPTNITPDQLAQFQEAQAGLTSALSRLLVTVERYPELKANRTSWNCNRNIEMALKTVSMWSEIGTMKLLVTSISLLKKSLPTLLQLLKALKN